MSKKAKAARGGPLFDPSRVIERTTSFGSHVRVRVTPEPGGMVRILEWHRKRDGGSQYTRMKDEEGQLATLAQLGISESHEEFFGAQHVPAATPAATPAPKRRRRSKA